MGVVNVMPFPDEAESKWTAHEETAVRLHPKLYYASLYSHIRVPVMEPDPCSPRHLCCSRCPGRFAISSHYSYPLKGENCEPPCVTKTCRSGFIGTLAAHLIMAFVVQPAVDVHVQTPDPGLLWRHRHAADGRLQASGEEAVRTCGELKDGGPVLILSLCVRTVKSPDDFCLKTWGDLCSDSNQPP